MANVYLKAYTAHNLGDDLFVKILCERYPNTQFHMVGNSKYTRAFKSINNLKIIKRNFPIKVLDRLTRTTQSLSPLTDRISNRLIRQSDAIIQIGGSIFMQGENWQKRWSRFNDELKLNNNYYIIGCNFGPFNSSDYLEAYRSSFEKLKDICFRDKASYDLFSDISTARLSTDVVFTFGDSSASQKSSQRVIISMIDLSGRPNLRDYRSTYEKKMTDLVNALVHRDYEVTLMNFCIEEGDDEASNRVISSLNKSVASSVDVYSYTGNLDEALKLIRNSQAVVANRFHSMILGWIYGLRVYPLIYSTKTINMIQDTNYSGPYTDLENVSSLNLDQVVNHLINSPPHNIEDQKMLAQQQFIEIDKYLNS